MRLSKIFESLTHGTLAGLAIANTSIGEISPDNYPRLITLINAGLLDLYTQFNLRTRDITIQLWDGQSIYPLHSDYAESNTTSGYTKHILDGTVVHPFNDNIIVIDEVYDEIGDRVPLNDLSQEFSVFTPSPHEIQVPYANRENILSLVYRATPDIIDTSLLDPSSEEVDLPYQYLQALTYFIAWQMHTPIDGADNPKGMLYQSNYLSAIRLLKDTGNTMRDNFTNQRFEANGWL